MIPNRIKLSKRQPINCVFKTKTGLTPNILSRIAIMLAIREGGNLSNAGVGNMEGGQELNDTTLLVNIFIYMIF